MTATIIRFNARRRWIHANNPVVSLVTRNGVNATSTLKNIMAQEIMREYAEYPVLVVDAAICACNQAIDRGGSFFDGMDAADKIFVVGVRDMDISEQSPGFKAIEAPEPARGIPNRHHLPRACGWDEHIPTEGP